MSRKCLDVVRAAVWEEVRDEEEGDAWSRREEGVGRGRGEGPGEGAEALPLAPGGVEVSRRCLGGV